jgi:hypothetical protein
VEAKAKPWSEKARNASVVVGVGLKRQNSRDSSINRSDSRDGRDSRDKEGANASNNTANASNTANTSTSNTLNTNTSNTANTNAHRSTSVTSTAAAVAAALSPMVSNKEERYTMVETSQKARILLITITSSSTITDTVLEAKVISADGQVCLTAPLNVKLPSIGLVDREAARQFACAVADKLYAEEVSGCVERVELKMRE